MYGDGRSFCGCHHLFLHIVYIPNVGRFCFSDFDGITGGFDFWNDFLIGTYFFIFCLC